MKFSQIGGINNFSVAFRGDQKFNRVFHPVSTTPPRELKNDNSLIFRSKCKAFQEIEKMNTNEFDNCKHLLVA